MVAVEIDITVTGQICNVVPGHVKIKNGEHVQWNNLTGGDVIVFFPHDKVFGPLSAHFHHKIHDADQFETLTSVSGRTPGDHFPYAIYSAVTNSFAEGGSNPEIIID